MGTSDGDKIFDEFRLAAIEAKKNLKYGLLQISERKWAVIEITGASRYGEPETGWFLHGFHFVEGCEKMRYSTAVERIGVLTAEHAARLNNVGKGKGEKTDA